MARPAGCGLFAAIPRPLGHVGRESERPPRRGGSGGATRDRPWARPRPLSQCELHGGERATHGPSRDSSHARRSRRDGRDPRGVGRDVVLRGRHPWILALVSRSRPMWRGLRSGIGPGDEKRAMYRWRRGRMRGLDSTLCEVAALVHMHDDLASRLRCGRAAAIIICPEVGCEWHPARRFKKGRKNALGSISSAKSPRKRGCDARSPARVWRLSRASIRTSPALFQDLSRSLTINSER